jgi:hypothetical protein
VVGEGVLSFANTGVTWTEGQYRELRVEMDPIADSLRYYYGGALIYTGLAGTFAGTSVEQVVLINDNFQLAGETADFDNINVVPAPASLALLGFAALATRRRRA